VATPAFLDTVISLASKYLPFFDYGLGWLCPAVIGFVIGMVLERGAKKA
jgi:LIVCS family branched-chain amino acid:cation transporter